MIASTSTLQDVVNSLPASLGMRYKPQFFVQAGNEILSDIEKAGDPDVFRQEGPLLLRESVSRYRLPDGVRRILGVFPAVPGCETPDYDSPVDFTMAGSLIKFSDFPRMSGFEDLSGAATDGDENEMYSGSILASKGVLIGRAVVIAHEDGSTESRVIAANDGAGTITFDGPLDFPVEAGDTFLITADYFWLRYSKYFDRFVYSADIVALGMGKAIPLDQAFETAFRYGMTWKTNMQSEKSSKESQGWEQNFRTEIEKAIVSFQVAGQATPRNIPRQIPSLF